MALHMVFVLTALSFVASDAQSLCADYTAIGASCFSEPTDCSAVNDCEMTMVVEKPDNETFTFTLTGKSDGWVAVGISADRVMGKDDVLMCLQEDGEVKLLDRFNRDGAKENRASFSMILGEQLVLISKSYQQGIISCTFNRSIEVTGENGKETFSLKNTARYLLFGRGPATSGEPNMHLKNPWVSDNQVDLNVGGKIEITESLNTTMEPDMNGRTTRRPRTTDAANTAICVSRLLFVFSSVFTVFRLW